MRSELKFRFCARFRSTCTYSFVSLCRSQDSRRKYPVQNMRLPRANFDWRWTIVEVLRYGQDEIILRKCAVALTTLARQE